MMLRLGDEGMLCAVKLDSKRVARGTHAGSVVVEELVPFSGIIGGERGRRSRAPGTIFVPQLALLVKPLSGFRDIKTRGI